MQIKRETPKQPDVIDMLAQLDAYCAALYPAESNHLMNIDALCAEHIVFMVARDADSRATGCCAYVNHGAYAEVKRMFVDPAQRGEGIGIKLLGEITHHAAAAGLSCLRLETGIHQPEAIGLYERAGFVRCAPFGGYQIDPLSLFMEKTL